MLVAKQAKSANLNFAALSIVTYLAKVGALLVRPGVVKF